MDDAISRQGAIDFVGSMEMCDEISAEAYKKLTNYFEEMPSAQPKKGKWIRIVKHHKDDEQEYGYYEISCSECGAIRKIGWHDARYCPNCGADMETEHD